MPEIVCKAHKERGGVQFCILCLREAWDRAGEFLEALDSPDAETETARDRLREALSAEDEPAR